MSRRASSFSTSAGLASSGAVRKSWRAGFAGPWPSGDGRPGGGEDPTPLRLWAPSPVFEESAECAWGIEALEPLGDLMAGLAEVLCARLRRDELTADSFGWVCRLADRTVHEGVCAPAAPLADPAAAAAVLRASLAARPPRAAVEGVTLRAHPLRPPKAQPRFDESPRPSPRLRTHAPARL